MKVQKVGTENASLLWPDRSAMAAFVLPLTNPEDHKSPDNHETIENPNSTTTFTTTDLLWPSSLINAMARARQKRSFAKPLAITTFILSVILAFAVGPMQLILIVVHSADYNWITEVYYPTAFRYTMLIGAFVALIDLVIIFSLWRSNQRINSAIMLTFGSLAELLLIWFLHHHGEWLPHQLSLILIAAVLVFVMVILFIDKQANPPDSRFTLAKITLGLTALSSLSLALGGITYFVQTGANANLGFIGQITANQLEARLPDVPPLLSDAIYTLCDGRYQTVYLTENTESGIFECTANGEVYHTSTMPQTNDKLIRTAATYLGTTKDSAVSLAFPYSHYLYRSIPQALSEDELVLMFSAHTERELLDNLTPALLEYWQSHNDHNLYLNIFYNGDLDTIATTRDFVLMAALDTMIMTEQLPHGNTIKGYHDGESVSYIYQADASLAALNELGLHPEFYPVSTLSALTMNRHLSLHLKAGETYDSVSLKLKLMESFVDK